MAVINHHNNDTLPAIDDAVLSWLAYFTERQQELFALITDVCMCGFIGLWGIIGNIINLIVFYRQGLDTTINISLFAMAVSDLCSLLLQEWFILWGCSLFEKVGLPIIYSDFQYITGGVTREAFSRITCLITVYITAERCLCITFPLKIKDIITPKRTTVVILSIYISTWMSGIPVYCTTYLDWKFYPDRNRTLLGLMFTEHQNITERVAYFIHAIFGVLSVMGVAIFTSILIRKLGETSLWRKSVNIQQAKSESLSARDRTAIFMVVLVAILLLICYTPSVILCVTTFLVPEFCVSGKYYNLYHFLWAFALIVETINSSVNIFLYLKMSTKYRRTFKYMFLGAKRSDVDMYLPTKEHV